MTRFDELMEVEGLTFDQALLVLAREVGSHFADDSEVVRKIEASLPERFKQP